MCRPRDFDLSEFHPKATRTLFVGNISREVVPAEIHERFKEFGEILEIDIKKPDYALVQFVDIRSVVRAIRAVDGEVQFFSYRSGPDPISFKRSGSYSTSLN
jgi:RNA recognition motif-containing protein